MKKLISLTLLTMATFTAPSTFAQDAEAQESRWIRDVNDFYRYYAFEKTGTNVNASFSLVEYQDGNENIVKRSDFRLLWENEKFCSTYKDVKGVITQATYYVNNQPVMFNISCYKNKTVNVSPVNDKEGKEFILKAFEKARGKPVTFVQRLADSEDVIYQLPSLGFSDFSKEVFNATRAPL